VILYNYTSEEGLVQENLQNVTLSLRKASARPTMTLNTSALGQQRGLPYIPINYSLILKGLIHKENKSPWQLAQEKHQDVPKEALMLPPADLDDNDNICYNNNGEI